MRYIRCIALLAAGKVTHSLRNGGLKALLHRSMPYHRCFCTTVSLHDLYFGHNTFVKIKPSVWMLFRPDTAPHTYRGAVNRCLRDTGWSKHVPVGASRRVHARGRRCRDTDDEVGVTSPDRRHVATYLLLCPNCPFSMPTLHRVFFLPGFGRRPWHVPVKSRLRAPSACETCSLHVDEE